MEGEFSVRGVGSWRIWTSGVLELSECSDVVVPAVVTTGKGGAGSFDVSFVAGGVGCFWVCWSLADCRCFLWGGLFLFLLFLLELCFFLLLLCLDLAMVGYV